MAGWPCGRVAVWPPRVAGWPGGRGRGRVAVAVAGWPGGRVGRVGRVAGWPWPGRGRDGRQQKKAIGGFHCVFVVIIILLCLIALVCFSLHDVSYLLVWSFFSFPFRMFFNITSLSIVSVFFFSTVFIGVCVF